MKIILLIFLIFLCLNLNANEYTYSVIQARDIQVGYFVLLDGAYYQVMHVTSLRVLGEPYLMLIVVVVKGEPFEFLVHAANELTVRILLEII